MKKLICFLILLIGLFLCFSHSTVEYKAQPSLITPVEVVLTPKTAPRHVLTHKTTNYAPNTVKIAEIADLVNRETSIPCETITKIILAESSGNPNAVHVNKNGTKDYGIFQINSVHLSEAKKMGLDLLDPDDNTEFAIFLIRTEGLKPWIYSKNKWSVVE